MQRQIDVASRLAIDVWCTRYARRSRRTWCQVLFLLLRVADSKTMNRTRLVGFFIVDGDCLRRLVRIILVKRKVGKM